MTATAGGRLRAYRWLWPAVLLLGEYLALSVAIDVEPLARHGGPWRAVAQTGVLAALAVALAGAAALVLARRPVARTEGGPQVRDRRRVTAWLVGNGVAFTAFAALTLAAAHHPIGTAWGAVWWVLAAAPALTLLPLLGPGNVRIGPRRALLVGAAILAVGASAWGAGLGATHLWAPLGTATLWTAAIMLRPWSAVRVDEASQALGTEDFAVTIAPECSGYEGIGLALVFIGAYLWLFRKQLHLRRALWLLPVTVAVVWLANALRIASLVVVGSSVSPAIAVGGFHSKAGWLLFCAVTLGIAAGAQRVRWLQRDCSEPDCSADADRSVAGSADAFAVPEGSPPAAAPTTVHLMPLLVFLAASMAGALFTTDFAWFYPLPVAAASIVLWRHRHRLVQLHRAPSRSAPWWRCGYAVAIGVLVFALWMALEPASSEQARLGFAEHLSAVPTWAAAGWLTLRVLGSVVVIPIVEELAFRGYLLRRLIARGFETVSMTHFTCISFLLSSLAFGALHQRWVAGTLAGMLFAIACYRRGRLTDAIVAHAVANALIAVAALLGGWWHLWS